MDDVSSVGIGCRRPSCSPQLVTYEVCIGAEQMDFAIDIPSDWTVDTQCDTDSCVFACALQPHCNHTCAGVPEAQPVVLVVEQCSCSALERSAEHRKGMLQNLSAVGEVIEPVILDDVSLPAGFAEWQVSVRMDAADDADAAIAYDTDPRTFVWHTKANPPVPEMIGLWCAVCVREGHSFTFQLSQGHDFCSAIRRARDVVASMRVCCGA
eukprot:TRINITY_DN8585_c0_g1_i1.p2 TRINITY_DN8585_c0_g1~~TRINITY_DN8585_c0_g1_i1.p2  ORF type:complete len:210 (+),score=37.02 TRINITY_DN8585_c0_g1_i1:74-703(+)